MWLSHALFHPLVLFFIVLALPFIIKSSPTVLAIAPLLLFYSREYTRISFHSTVPSSSPKIFPLLKI